MKSFMGVGFMVVATVMAVSNTPSVGKADESAAANVATRVHNAFSEGVNIPDRFGVVSPNVDVVVRPASRVDSVEVAVVKEPTVQAVKAGSDQVMSGRVNPSRPVVQVAVMTPRVAVGCVNVVPAVNKVVAVGQVSVGTAV
jgi:hypothetical protein